MLDCVQFMARRRACVVWEPLVLAIVTVSLQLSVAHASEPGQVQPGPTQASDPDAVDRVIPPRALHELELVYPDELASRGQAPGGEVEVRFVVDTTGVPRELELVRRLHPVLDMAAMVAVRKLRFVPAQYEGQQVEVIQTIVVPFVPPESTLDVPRFVDPPPVHKPEPVDIGPLRISGHVLEGGRRYPVVGVEIVAVPAQGDGTTGTVSATADETGAFQIHGLADGPVRLRIVSPQFRDFKEDLTLVAGELLEVKLYLDRREVDPYTTTVVTERQKTDVVRRSLSAEELATAPGSLGDPLRALQNLPGVARTPFGAGGLMIRGTAAHQSALFIDGHPLPRLYHFFAISTVFHASILESIDFVPGSFSARYGNAIGGIVNAHVAEVKEARGVHGQAGLSLIDLSGKAQVQVGRGSLVLAGRRSHIDPLVGLALRVSGEDYSIPVPRYWDYQTAFDHPLGQGRFWLRAFGSDDRMVNVPVGKQEDATIDLVNGFHRVDLGYEIESGPLRWTISPSYMFEADRFGFDDAPDFNQETNRHNVSVRTELRHRVGKSSHLTLGSYGMWSQWHSERPAILDPTWDETSANDGERAKSSGSRSQLASYLLGHFELGPVILMPEVRYSLFGEPFARGAIDPRLRIGFSLAPKTQLTLGGGIYSQAPAFSVYEGSYRTRSADHERPRLERSAHAGITLGQDLPGRVRLELTGYYAYMWNLVQISAINVMVPLFVAHSILPDATTTGHRFGLEFIARKELSKYWYGWVSYSFSRSIRKEAGAKDWVLFDFDQTHNLTAVLGVKFPRHYRISSRFRLTSGNPYTACNISVFDTAWDAPYCIPSAKNSSRLPMYHQLDLRFDKTWTRKLAKIMVYLDLNNVYHQKNIEFVLPGSGEGDEIEVYGMPMLPIFGMEVKF